MARRAFLAAGLVVLLAAPAWAQPKSAPAKGDPVVARVNGQVLHRSDIEMVMHNLPPEARQAPPEQVYLNVLNRMANSILLAQASHKAKIDQEPAVKAEIQISNDDLLASAYINSLARAQITEAKLKEAYEKYKEEASNEVEVRARHILVPTEKEADEIIAQLNKGADFATLAKEKTTDPPGKANGGDLGYFTRNEMVPAFAAAAFALKKGEYTQSPVHTQYGWHVIKVEDRRPVKVGTYEQVAPELAQHMEGQLAADKIGELRKKGKVELFDPTGKPLKMAEAPQPRAAAPERPAEAARNVPPLAMPGGQTGAAPGAPTLAPGTAPDQLRR
jgi:peptidyl-prolyl cis-trans isomerase C